MASFAFEVCFVKMNTSSSKKKIENQKVSSSGIRPAISWLNIESESIMYSSMFYGN